MRALFSGVTGLRSHQVRMDVIGNNIANVNTTGFKSSRVTFQDVFSQTLSSGSAQTTPQQVGLGVGVASTDLMTGAGSFQLTGRELDLAIEGNGMFILKGADGQNMYTRAGNFDWDAEGFLVNPATGLRVQGWTATKGVVGNTDRGSLTNIQLIKGDVALAEPTKTATMSGNLDAGTATNTTGTPDYSTTLTAYDSLGRAQSVILNFTKTGDNQWKWSYQVPGAATPVDGTPDLTFNTDGTIQGSAVNGTISFTPTGADPLSISVDFSAMTHAYAGTAGSSVLVRKADGFPMGTLESVSVSPMGEVQGVFSNGFRRTLAQVGMALFTNPAGLLKVGGTNFSETAASGVPVVGKPNSGGRGRLVPGNLEMSNVDLSTEFTNMIITQRGFQANTRIISAADEMIQDLVNLRR